jgi:hypothetical protein
MIKYQKEHQNIPLKIKELAIETNLKVCQVKYFIHELIEMKKVVLRRIEYYGSRYLALKPEETISGTGRICNAFTMTIELKQQWLKDSYYLHEHSESVYHISERFKDTFGNETDKVIRAFRTTKIDGVLPLSLKLIDYYEKNEKGIVKVK